MWYGLIPIYYYLEVKITAQSVIWADTDIRLSRSKKQCTKCDMGWYRYTIISKWKSLHKVWYELIPIYDYLVVKTTAQSVIWADTDIRLSRSENHCTKCDMGWYRYTIISKWKSLHRVWYGLIPIYDYLVVKTTAQSVIWADTDIRLSRSENHCTKCDMSWYRYTIIS